ncbi:MAG: hypothetical protein IJR52_02655 [Selenomonadaceae bacterium]|nr:hypothetical protein [Selenomonadaceae bacterium]MBQ9496458.1 hypothetical protein [Selenomonadaceae bacterium]
MIHVCFGLYDKNGTYSKFTGTTMLSVFENSNTPQKLPSITIHILHDNTLTLDNREKFSYLAGQYNQLVKFYNVEELYADKINEMLALMPEVKNYRCSVGTAYRLFVANILPADVDKIIYLDSDIIVNLDLKELWQVELGDKPFAAVPESSNGTNTQGFALCREGYVRDEDYFNSGVLLINTKVFGDEKFLMSGMKFIGEHPQFIHVDQDVVNYLFSKDYLKLPAKFNFFTVRVRHLEEINYERVIYHFAGPAFGITMNNPFNRLWLKYFSKTPWFGAETVEHLYESFNQIHVGLKNSMIQISAAMSGKTRAFFTAPVNVNALKNIFLVRDDEEIFLAENQSSLKKLIDAMNASRGKKVFIILLLGFPFQSLTAAGFVFGKDFFDGMEFLSAANGLPLDSYQLIKAM